MCACDHHSVVEFSGGFVGADRDGLLEQDITGINFVLEQEGGDTGCFFAPYNGPVDGSGSSVFGE